jgi:hypothetical protein
VTPANPTTIGRAQTDNTGLAQLCDRNTRRIHVEARSEASRPEEEQRQPRQAPAQLSAAVASAAAG